MEIAAELLGEAGFSLGMARDGEEAVEAVRNSRLGEYDLVLMDIQMPKMNGFEATREIRKLPDNRLADIPIFAMTANAFAEDVSDCLKAGMDAHIAKPVNLKIMLSEIRKYAGKRHEK